MINLSPAAINWITNIAGLIMIVAEPLNTYFSSGHPFNVLTFLICIAGAITSYFTGKGAIALQNKAKANGGTQ